ncbi:hypothetical protein GN958_ATG00378 [Phytophthora infestans]|uniref:Secreted RxLR effector peptide protein n=1 Tax=Phytophthora infestans TaxID=4787 RepID=A0A8S9VCI5_PHYIN|nr:hypothetical protein GN958_ATG00378 [Phytophthora infestans]
MAALYVLFFVLGSIAPRADVDNRTLREKSGFWKDVQAAFVQRYPLDHELEQLMFDHELFRGVDPSVVKPHSSKKLFDMSKEVIRLYFSAEERFTASGKNENDFANFVNKNGAVFYLPKWLNVRQKFHFIKQTFLRSYIHACSESKRFLGAGFSSRLQEVRELLLLERQKWIEKLRSVEL